MVVGDYICESLAGQRPANTRDGQRSDKTRPLAVTPQSFSLLLCGDNGNLVWKHVKNTLLHIFTALVFIPIIPLLVMVGIITAVPVLTLMILFVPI
ncbi:MAG: hypothetical protein CMJ74_09230 [Planctomycetaceae bacterium]|nr:hypothetical protein [Planctomycetaceae bacterium]